MGIASTAFLLWLICDGVEKTGFVSEWGMTVTFDTNQIGIIVRTSISKDFISGVGKHDIAKERIAVIELGAHTGAVMDELIS